MQQSTVSNLDIVGDKMVVGSWLQQISTWNLRSGSELAPRIDTGAQLLTLRFSPDGKRFAAGGIGHYAMLWDGETNKPVASLPHDSGVEDLHFSRDSRLLVTSAQDNTVRLWHLATRKPVGPLLKIRDLTKVRFDADDRILFTGFEGEQQKLFTWERPPRVEGDPEMLRLWVTVESGLELQSDGNHRVLSPVEWKNAATSFRKMSSPNLP